MQITWTNVKSALVSGAIMGILGVSGYVIGVNDIFALNWHTLANIGVISALTTVTSLMKEFLTTPAGNFAGINIVQQG